MIKKKDIAGIPIKMPKKQDKGVITARAAGKVLVLDCFQDGAYIGRYCMDAETNRHQSWDAKTREWSEIKLMTLFGYSVTGYYSSCFWLEG